MTDPFTHQVGELCRVHPTRAKWVFVRSHAAGRTLGDRLVLDGTDWANLRFVTPLDVALRMGAPFLVERGLDPTGEGLGPALVMRLLAGLPDGPAYFRPLAGQPGMAAALWSTIRELRLAGIRAADLPESAFVVPGKAHEFRALLEAYEAFLAEHARGDAATVYEEALRHPDWCPIGPADCWTEQPGVAWAPLERSLIDAMPGERITPATLELPGTDIPRRLKNELQRSQGPKVPGSEGARNQPSDQLQFDQIDQESASAASPPGTVGPWDSGTLGPSRLFFFTAGGPESEVEEVFRRILATGEPLDQVEIACTPAYTALVWEKACRWDWPVTLAAGVPAALTRPGRALLGLAEWVEDDFAAGVLRRLLQSGDITAPKRAAALLVRAEAAWGRNTYRLALGRLAKSELVRAERDDVPEDEREACRARAEEAGVVERWIAGVVEAVPEPGEDGQVDVQALVSCAEAFLRDHAARPSALDAAASAVLAEAVAELRALGEHRASPADALRLLRERVESATVGADRARPGHLHVSGLASAGLAGRRHLFVVGLEEGRVFPASFEDPILLDAERVAISPALALSTDRTDEAVHAVLGRLAAASAAPDSRVTFSYSCRDLRQFRETYASWLMLHAFRVATNDPKAGYRELHAALGVPVSVVPRAPEDAPGVGRWWLAGVTRAGADAGRTAVLTAWPPLAAGQIALAERASDRFTAWDGHVPEAGPVLDPSAPGRIVSVSALEEAAECPYRHFLQRGLGIRAIESGERSGEVWLDPRLRGTLLHDLYAACLRRSRGEARRPSLEEDRAWLLDRGRAVLAELKHEMPPASAEIEARETDEFLADLEVFLRAESDAGPAREPVGFEVAFGRTPGAEPEPLASIDPVRIDLGDVALTLAGRIDRIDRADGSDGTPEYHVVDYKTGRYWKDDWQGTFAGGRRLQHAVYGLAANELLRRASLPGRVATGEYYFPTGRGQMGLKQIPAQPLAAVGAVLGDLRDVIRSGAFVHAPDKDDCRYCRYHYACGRPEPERIEAKLADPVLDPVRRLATHE